MQLWLSRHSDTTIREQLSTQVVLAILSGELAPGQRLPSTRELARRFRLHANTVSAAYRQLERDDWLEFRKGSGVYVRKVQRDGEPNGFALDRLIVEFFRSARKLNAPQALVRSRLKQWLEMQTPDHFLLIEPDQELAKIVIHEMRSTVTLPVSTIAELNPEQDRLNGALPVVLSISAKRISRAVLDNTDILTLQLRSARESLAPYLPVSPSMLVGIASAWPPFLKSARTMLISAGFHPDCLIVHDTRKPRWRRGFAEVAAVVCDSLTATLLDGHSRAIPFRMLSEQSRDELRRYEKFITNPLDI